MDLNFRRFDSMVRRADVAFRARFPDLATKIFGFDGGQRYAIYVEGSAYNFDLLRREFEKVRPAGLYIGIIEGLPQSFDYEIDNINDIDIAKNLEGFPFSRQHLTNILLSHLPSLPLSDETSSCTDPITFFLTEEPNSNELERARAVLQGILPGFRFAFETRPKAAIKPLPKDVQQRLDQLTNIDVKPSKRRPDAPPFVRDDEEFWFASVEDILSGRLKKRSIVDMDDDGMACYIDASVGSQFDLRQAILLYDTIYLTPPISVAGTHFVNFWEQQVLTKADMLALVEAGRLRFILSQPEERTDPDFLREVYSINPKSVIGRLKSSAVIASDIVATARDYKFADPAIIKQLSVAAQAIGDELNIAPDLVIRTLLWPLSARRSCVGAFTSRGLMGLPTFGLGNILSEELMRATGRDLQLESMVTTMGVQVAHSLNATFIPPSDDLRGWNVPRLMIGERLNFFRDYNSRTAAAWALN